MLDDSELLNAWRAGDRAAGEALLERYRVNLARYFRRRAGWNTDDLVQETLLACVRCRDRFAGQSSFRTYVFAIARKILHRALERERQSGDVPAPDGHRHPSDGAERGDERDPWPGAVPALGERWDVWRALQQLGEDERRLIWLYYWEDLSGSQLARALGVLESTARSRLRRSLERIRDGLKAAPDHEEPWPGRPAVRRAAAPRCRGSRAPAAAPLRPTSPRPDGTVG